MLSKNQEWNSFGDIIILSIEDDSFNQEFTSAVFIEIDNITVLQADNGEEALKILSNAKVDIVLLDLMMPDIDGFEILRIIKNNDKYKDIPVIIVTAETNEKKRTYKLGADDFISKPYNPSELNLRVLNNIKIKKFSTLINNIKENKDISENHLSNLKEALYIANSSQKQLLTILGNLSHANGDQDEKASIRLGEYAKHLSRLYGLNNREIEEIYYSMSIYDIGLLYISKDKLFNMSQEYQQHPQLGLNILTDIEESNLIKMAKIVTIEHHENWNGTGFPNALKQEDISIYSRIVSIIDYFDGLTSSRGYDRDKMALEDALEVMKREGGIKFDPTLLEIFINNFDDFVLIYNKY